MSSLEALMTDRLDLRCPDPEKDLDQLFQIFSDPDGWWYDPQGRHLDPAQTKYWLSRAAGRFGADRLSYWTVRRLADGAVIGVGGAQRQRTGAWNINYRIAGAHQGHGYATELGHAAQEAATSVDPGVPIIAWIAERNVPSRRVAERLGLQNDGPAVDPSDGDIRLAYSDRPIGDFHG